MKPEHKNTLKVVSVVVREFQSETVAINPENNTKLIYMVVKQLTMKRSHASTLVDKNATIATVKRDSRETVERVCNLNKDVRLAMKNANSKEKLDEYKKKKAYDMSIHVQFLKDDMEDSRDKVNFLQV